MNSKRMVIATFSLLLSALLIMGAINFAIDPLFQYHKPWFGLKANVIDERYQNAGIAKNFEFENVIIGNSMSENFLVSDVEELFDGTTVKLTASGSYVLDWTYLLDILADRQEPPQNILMNLDSGFFDASSKETRYEMPMFLYDNNYLNDVEYLFNFTLTRKYSYGAIKANESNTIPNYDTIFAWTSKYQIGKDVVLAEYETAKKKKKAEDIASPPCFYTDGNLRLLGKYFEEMPETQFVFFCSPFSVLYWKEKYDSDMLEEYKAQFEKTFEFMSQYENVTVYFWTDKEMLGVISDLDNYKDSTHYGMHINKEMILRMGNDIGVLSKDENQWKPLLDEYFDYLENFDYETIFE